MVFEEHSPLHVDDSAEGLDVLRGRVGALLERQPRVLLGLCGPPGVGKSFVSKGLVGSLGADSVVVPMDGFHLAQSVLEGEGTAKRKGAIFTFDGWGFVSLVERLRKAEEPVTYAPSFSRDLEEPVSGSIPVPREIPLVIIEGNYLLVDEFPWGRLAELLDEVWFLEIDDGVRLERLVARHIESGKNPEQAKKHVLESDELNTEFIRSTRDRANVIVERH